MAQEKKNRLPYVYVNIDHTEPPAVARGYGNWTQPQPQQPQPYGSQQPQQAVTYDANAQYTSNPGRIDMDVDASGSAVPLVVPVFHKVVEPEYPAQPSPYGQSPYSQQASYGMPQASNSQQMDSMNSVEAYLQSQMGGYQQPQQTQQSAQYAQAAYYGQPQPQTSAPQAPEGLYMDPQENAAQLGIQPYQPYLWYNPYAYGYVDPYGYPYGYADPYGQYPQGEYGQAAYGQLPIDPYAQAQIDPYAQTSQVYQQGAYGQSGQAAQQNPYAQPDYGQMPYGQIPYAPNYGQPGYPQVDFSQNPYAPQAYSDPYGMYAQQAAAAGATATVPPAQGGPNAQGAPNAPGMTNAQAYYGQHGQVAGADARQPKPMNPDESADATPADTDNTDDEIGAPLLDKRAIQESTMFDEPPVSIADGMKSLESDHKKRKRALAVALIALAVVAVALVVVLFILITSGVGSQQGTPQTTSSASLTQSSSASSATSAKPSSSKSSGANANKSGTVVYQYSAKTTSGVQYNVKETVTFQSNGDCEFTTMELTFPDEASCSDFVTNLARDYGSNFTLDSQSGANAVVTIDNSGLHLDRDEYENALRYSVEDLVILKK